MRRLKFLLLFAWTAALLALTLWRYPVPVRGSAACVRSLASAAALLAASLMFGRALLRRFRLYHGSLVEEAGFSLALGLAALSFVGSVLGALGVLYGWLAWGLIILACIVFFGHGEALADALRRSLRSKHPWQGSSSEIATVLCLALSALAVLAMAGAPPKFFDALVYHLAQAQRAAASGRIQPQAQVLFTWLPSLPGPLWALALVLDGAPAVSALAPAALNVALFVALGLMLMDASARLFNDRRIWLAPALALTQPMLALTFGAFSPDAWCAFFAFVSLDAFLLGLGDPVRRSQASWLLLSAVLAGAAAASKPVALIHGAALLVLAGTLAWKESSWRRPGLLLAAFGLFFLPLLPWMLQGFVLKGQPFYPFAVRFFGWTLSSGGPASYFAHVNTFGGSGWRAWLRLPWAAFFDVNSLGGDGHPGFLLLALAPAVLVWRLDRPLRWTLYYLFLGAVAWALGPHVLRYAVCLLPAASLLAAYGILEVETWAFSRTWSHLWRGLVLIGLFCAAAETFTIAIQDFNPLPAALGLVHSEDYLAAMGVPQAKVAQWIRERRPTGARVLVLGDERTAYLPPDSLAASVFETHPMAGWVGQAGNPQEVGAIVRAKGYDFVYFNGGEWDRLRSGGSGPLYWPDGDAAGRARFFAWLDQLRTLPTQDVLVLGGLLVAHLR